MQKLLPPVTIAFWKPTGRRQLQNLERQEFDALFLPDTASRGNCNLVKRQIISGTIATHQPGVKLRRCFFTSYCGSVVVFHAASNMAFLEFLSNLEALLKKIS
jgi:hypothetical protein